MSTTDNDIQMADEAAISTASGKRASIDLGFRWLDDITIELADGRPDSKLQLEVSADIENRKFDIRKGKNRTIRRVKNDRISCDKTKEIVIKLFEYKRTFKVFDKKVPILSMNVPLEDDVLYTEETYTNDDGASVAITFAYTPAGELRDSVEKARKITKEQKVVLDKIRRVHLFLQSLDSVCGALKDAHPFFKVALNAMLSMYKLCEKQKECRDAVRMMVDEMGDTLDYGVDDFGNMLRVNSGTRAAFRRIVGIFDEISVFISEHNKGIASGLRDTLSSSYETKLKELQNKLKRAKEALRNSINFGTWKRVVDTHLRSKLGYVLKAHYSSDEGCLAGTRETLLAKANLWVRGTSTDKAVWIHGHAGSGKSALLNSIAQDLEEAGIPFIYFPCKRDDPELSDIHRILPTIAYILTELLDDYRGTISDTIDQPEGRSIVTGDIKKQAKLLFGESFNLISLKGSSHPPVLTLLIDAFDECINHRNGDKIDRERRALLETLLDFANTVPWVKVLITSRPQPDITEVFDDTKVTIRRININDDEWKTSADIRLFVEARSKELKLGLSLDQIDRFQEKASGLFIWCTTIFRYIEKSKKGKSDIVTEVLQDHPPDSKANPHAPLYSLYQHVLSSADADADDNELMETILGVLFVASSRRPLSATAITDILFPNERGDKLEGKREWVTNIIKSLFAIIYVEEKTEAVRTCHLSVLDYIGRILNGGLATKSTPGDSTDKTFSIGLEDIHARVFDGCFAIMSRELRFNMCGLENSHRLNKDVPGLPARIKQNISEVLRYGCLFWMSHLAESGAKGRGEQVFAFLNSPMALYWIEGLSLQDAVDLGIVAMQDCKGFFAAESDVAGIADEWERFLSAYGDASKSTPHLYLSALQWIPGNSSLWNIVRGSFSSGLPMISNVPAVWKNERWSENVGAFVNSVAYSPNGQFFVAGCGDGSIRFWNARSRKAERESFMTESRVYTIAISPGGHWLASGHEDSKIRLWDLRANSPVPRELEGHTGPVRSVAFLYGGDNLVSGSDDESAMFWEDCDWDDWDVESGTAIGYLLTEHDYYVTSVTVSADEKRILGSNGRTVRIWDLETDEQIGEPLEGDSVACSRDGRFIASTSNNETIILWDAQTYVQIGEFTGHTKWVKSLCFSFDSKYIASGSADNSVRVWNVDTRSMVCELKGHTSKVNSVAFSPDGRSLLSGSEDGTVRIWDAKETPSVDPPSTGSAEVLCVCYVPCSNLIVSGSEDGNLNFWDAQTGEAVGDPVQGHTEAVNALAVSSEGRWLVSGSDDKTLRIWDVVSRTPIGEPMLGHTWIVTSVAVSPDNRLFASASVDKTIRLWDVTTRKSVRSLEGHERSVTSVTFSVDGNYIISGSWDLTVRLWDVSTGKPVGHPLTNDPYNTSGILFLNIFYSVAVSPDGQWIASGLENGNVRIWSMETLTVTHEPEEHYSFVTSVSFSPNSQFLISGSCDASIIVWNVQNGEAFGDALTGHTRQINSVAFAPDGHEFASASSDGTIRVWDTRARTDFAMKRECVTDYDELSEEELLVQWNASRACAADNDGWVEDQEKLLLWVPWQHRDDIYGGPRLVIGAESSNTVQADYQKMFRYSGTRWTDIYTGKNS